MHNVHGSVSSPQKSYQIVRLSLALRLNLVSKRLFIIRGAMKIFTLFVLPLFLAAQTPIIVLQDTLVRSMPLIGFNTNAHHSVANWTIPAFRESTASLRPAILRYPGGTTANHWDWKSGWFQNAPTTPPELANINPKGTIRAEEFKLGTDASKAEGLFNINFQYSTLAYELKGLQHAESLGFAIRYIEIGNEHNLKISNQYIAPEVYAAGVKIWCDTLKKYFPQAKICAVGGAPPATPGWHDSIFARSPKMDALAFHVYLGAGNTDSTLNAPRALSIPFGQLGQRYTLSKFPSVPDSIEIWVTEFNLGENLAGMPRQHAETWTHGLYVASMIHLFLENPKITMIINHNLTNQMEFAAISPFDHHISANGVIMKLIGEVSKGMSTAVRLSFGSLPQQQSGTTLFPKLIGWKFVKGTEERGLIINLSSDTILCDLQGVFGLSSAVRQSWSDPLKKISGSADLQYSTGSSASPAAIMPYSVVQILPQQTTSVRPAATAPETFALLQNYPNPFNPATTIRYDVSQSGPVTLTVYDAVGRIVGRLVDQIQAQGSYTYRFDGTSLSSGLYIVELQSGMKKRSKKMILMK